MDAARFISSITQLAGAGLSLSIALYDYASNISNAPKKLNDLAQDVRLTSSVLEHLSEVFIEANERAFLRPGALHTAQDAIAGCSEIFEEMRLLIDEGRKGMGKYILPFKESKIQLMNARLANLKSTLQLLLQVLQYASSVNLDPNISQFSLSGSWVMSQFKILIDEREEAKRNFEQLKAEIGSVNSGLGEPSSSSNPQPKASVINEEEASEVQYSSTHVDAIEYASPNSSTRLKVAALPPDAVSAAQINEPKSGQAKDGPGKNDGNRPQDSSSGETMLVSLMHGIVIVFCCPCVYCDRRQKNLGPQRMTQELPPYPAVSLLGPTAVSAETAYQTLEMYGPVGITEIDSPGSHSTELPAPRILDTYFGDERRVELATRRPILHPVRTS
ncbi:hypothetical protein NA56DRAFT_702090 [Hyaloscypha hepaticicola]|uniref:Fungal N-terminal domain-containing protein n=1 Tax=Hyaloscypha hepaticicola TaxID=2082293 RepID=A0A2J6Q9R6_9HELO|nr:hypothetical protein NA56DRAFT_702090 [Hyaloscypha hepaticicola]